MKLFQSLKAARIGTTVRPRPISAPPCARTWNKSARRRSEICSTSATKNSAAWAILPKAKPQPHRAVPEMSRGSVQRLGQLLQFGVLFILAQGSSFASPFSFERDTFAFQNATVLKYKNGRPTLERRSTSDDPPNQYARRCFVMTRSAVQFHKFARFDPHGARFDDKELAARIRAVTRRAPWHASLPENQRIVFSGYANLREMSKARAHV